MAYKTLVFLKKTLYGRLYVEKQPLKGRNCCRNNCVSKNKRSSYVFKRDNIFFICFHWSKSTINFQIKKYTYLFKLKKELFGFVKCCF